MPIPTNDQTNSITSRNVRSSALRLRYSRAAIKDMTYNAMPIRATSTFMII